MSEEARDLAAFPSVVDFRNERLDIRPLKFGVGLDIICVASPVVEAIFARESGDAASVDDVAFFMGLIRQHRDDVVKVLALVAGRDADFIEGGDFAEVLELGVTAYAVNRDFFDQRLAPQLAAWRERVVRKGSGAGPTSPST